MKFEVYFIDPKPNLKGDHFRKGLRYYLQYPVVGKVAVVDKEGRRRFLKWFHSEGELLNVIRKERRNHIREVSKSWEAVKV